MSDPIERQDVIDEAEKWIEAYNSGRGGQRERDAIKHVISGIKKLPSAQPENADCIYCHEDSDGYVKPIEKNCHAFIRFGMDGWELDLKANGWHGSAKIRYCPMCGRKLKNDK